MRPDEAIELLQSIYDRIKFSGKSKWIDYQLEALEIAMKSLKENIAKEEKEISEM